MTLDEWRAFCLGKVIRLRCRDDFPMLAHVGIVRWVGAANPRTGEGMTGHIWIQLERAGRPPVNYHVDANNSRQDWHIEVYGGES